MGSEFGIDFKKTAVRARNIFLKDPVQACAAGLALLSCFFVHPSAAYADYIDFRVLALLYCLMGVVAGIRDSGAFDRLCAGLLKSISSLRKLMLVMTLLSFFLSMIITNDVTLVTLVPFTILLFRGYSSDTLIRLLVLETVAANLGSMLTPVGNPQNLFLFEAFHFEVSEFLRMMAPYTGLSLGLLLLLLLLFSSGSAAMPVFQDRQNSVQELDTAHLLFFLFLFSLCILSVARILDYRVLLVLVTAAILFVKPSLLLKVDYSLLVTFAFFFVFIGNMGSLDSVHAFLSTVIRGRELLTAVVSSQFISNVPAAMLLSGFTDQGRALVIGTDLGGLGTLIASMASLITYKLYGILDDSSSGKYIAVFTAVNVLFLCVLLGAAWILEA